MRYKLQDLIDIVQFQSLQDRLNEIYSFPSAIIDNEGRVLTATAWQDICTKFHRQHPECEKLCVKSDQYIRDHLHEANPAVSYQCPHGLIDNATPIIINGEHLGNFFTGQFFLEEPDLELFRKQAVRYGFAEEAYLDAVKKVPIWSRHQLDNYLYFIKGLIEVIANIGLKNLREIEARKESKKSEDRYRALLRTTTDGFWVVSQEGRLLQVNDAYCRMSGYDAQELQGMHISDIEAVESPIDTAAHIHGVMVKGQDRFETKHRRKNGGIYDVEISVQSQPGDEHLLVVFLRDITEWKRSEQKLIHAHQLMDYVISHARSAIAVHDKNLRYIYVSKRYLEDYKVQGRDIIGKHHYEVFPDLPQKWRDLHQRALRGEVFSSERDPYYRDDGSVEWTRWECRPWYESDGSIGGIIIYTEVITERVRAEERLRQSEARYRTFFEEAGDYVLLLEPNSDGVPIISDVNQAALRAHGFSREELIGKPITILDKYISPAVDDARAKSIANGQIATFEVRHYRKDGTTFDAEVRARRLRLGDKDVIVSIERDITERKRVERERQDLQEKLQRAEKMEALGKLAGGVAHDLNNVLGVSMGYAELLQDAVPEESPIRMYAGQILKSTQKGTAIIQDLLTLARRGVSVSKVITLNDAVSTVFQSPEFRLVQDQHPLVTFGTELDPGLLNIKGSPVHLEKTVFNLLSNAAEAITGSGVVTVRTENRYLDRPIQGYDRLQEGDYVVLAISDSGKGIRPHELNKIFEPFYTNKTMGRSGTGLGLTIVWGTVKDHSGYIDVQSREGQGSTFTLYFPVTREKVYADAAQTPLEQYLGHGESVLVVDDVPEQRQVATAMLNRLGYRVTTVAGGLDAIEYLRDHKPDILVLDMIMEPGIDGLETFKQALQINPGQKAIIVSGFSETERVKEAQRLGAGAYVKKPYIMEKIGLAIRQELDRP